MTKGSNVYHMHKLRNRKIITICLIGRKRSLLSNSSRFWVLCFFFWKIHMCFRPSLPVSTAAAAAAAGSVCDVTGSVDPDWERAMIWRCRAAARCLRAGWRRCWSPRWWRSSSCTRKDWRCCGCRSARETRRSARCGAESRSSRDPVTLHRCRAGELTVEIGQYVTDYKLPYLIYNR